MIRLALVEDNIPAMQALKDKLEPFEDLRIVHTAYSGKEIVDLLMEDDSVDLILMDIEMPKLDGITATQLIKEKYPTIKIVIITIFDNDESIFNAIKAGADSYILKETKPEKIHETIHDSIQGGAVMSPSIALKALQALKKSIPPHPTHPSDQSELSPREHEVLECLSMGLTNKRIAEKLFISPFTIKRHIENIYRKLQAQTRIELIANAKEKGLI